MKTRNLLTIMVLSTFAPGDKYLYVNENVANAAQVDSVKRDELLQVLKDKDGDNIMDHYQEFIDYGLKDELTREMFVKLPDMSGDDILFYCCKLAKLGLEDRMKEVMPEKLEDVHTISILKNLTLLKKWGLEEQIKEIRQERFSVMTMDDVLIYFCYIGDPDVKEQVKMLILQNHNAIRDYYVRLIKQMHLLEFFMRSDVKAQLTSKQISRWDAFFMRRIPGEYKAAVMANADALVLEHSAFLLDT